MQRTHRTRFDLSRLRRTTANLDMLQHFRTRVNVLQRPVSLGGESFSLTGHHEIMIPLLTAAIHECAHDPEGPLFTDNYSRHLYQKSALIALL